MGDEATTQPEPAGETGETGEPGSTSRAGEDGSGGTTALGGSEESTGGGSSGSSEGGSTTAAGPTFDDVEPVFAAGCGGPASCHYDPVMPTGGLSMDSRESFVDAPSSVAGMVIVSPGSLENSYLWHKISGTQADVGGTGFTMPMIGELPDPDRELIEAWILGGAR